jgi:hypothetical protein
MHGCTLINIFCNTLRLKLDSLTLCIKEYYELKLNLEYASKFVWEANSSLRMDLHDVDTL